MLCTTRTCIYEAGVFLAVLVFGMYKYYCIDRVHGCGLFTSYNVVAFFCVDLHAANLGLRATSRLLRRASSTQGRGGGSVIVHVLQEGAATFAWGNIITINLR